MSNNDDFGLSIFFLALALSLFFISIIHLVLSDSNMTLFLICVMVVVSIILGVSTSRQDKIIRYWRVVITTVDDGVYYLGRNLSWADANKLRDDTLKKFESKSPTLSVKCTSSSGRYGVRNFVKSNIVHIGWLED